VQASHLGYLGAIETACKVTGDGRPDLEPWKKDVASPP
jgi:hypothetical protein